MWVCQLQRGLSQSLRLPSSRLLTIQRPSSCQLCLKRQFSQQKSLRFMVFSSTRRPVHNVYGVPKRLLATSGDSRSEKIPTAGTSAGEGATAKSEGENSSQADTIVKGRKAKKPSTKAGTILMVQPTVKTKTPRKKTDFNKDYQDNIFIESDRARFEYLLTDEQLGKLPHTFRRSPYPGSDNIKVYHRQHVMNKVTEVWGSMDRMRSERDKILGWQNIDPYVYKLRKAQQSYQMPCAGGSDEKPFIYKPYEAPSTGAESIFKSGSGKVVLWAITINGLNVLTKFVAWLYTGSHSMFAECVHSMADTVNQIILAVGIHQSLKKPDQEHPYGWSNFRNVASLISGVGIFCLGAGFSIYHGVMGLLNPHTMDSLYWGIAILGGSFLSEGGTLLVAINEVRRSAKCNNMSFSNYVWQGRDPSTNVVLLEDAGAVLGVAIAATCMSITYYTNNPFADAVGSLLVGSLLGGVASFIIYTNTISLVGRSIPIDQKAKLMSELENDRMIRALHDVKATDMGSSSVRFKAEVDFDGKEVTRSYLESRDLDALLNEVQLMKTSEELELFMLKHGENIVDRLGEEVDRIEKNLKKRHPEVRHVDLEQL